MKKFVSSLMAAIMVLSTTTIALAKDTDVDADVSNLPTLETTTTNAPTEDILYGEKSEFILSTEVLTDEVLGELLALEAIKFDITVTEGRNLLKKAPTISLAKVKEGPHVAKLTLLVKDTYSTDADEDSGDKDITLRVRITALKDLAEGEFTMKRGDTLSIDEIAFNAFYRELTSYGKDMTITAEEVSDKCVVAKMDEMRDILDEKNTNTATFYFGDIAAFTVKISETQKDMNLSYSTEIADEYYEEYPEVEFEIIDFMGTPKFMRKGTLTFKAIGDGDTAVYEITDKGLAELKISKYDAIYNVITVENISTLTSYLIASKSLVAEFIPSPTPDFVVPEEVNPNTGAV